MNVGPLGRKPSRSELEKQLAKLTIENSKLVNLLEESKNGLALEKLSNSIIIIQLISSAVQELNNV